jgi:tetratricopeptide (TPR) repeat protein
MRFKRILTAAVLLCLVACSRDPKVVRQRYLDSGNRHMEQGHYKEASIQYRNALKADARFGPAYYKLGLATLHLSQYTDSVNAFRRAIELLPETDSDRTHSVVQLSELYLASRNPEFFGEVENFCNAMIARDPNSFDGHRLLGDLAFARAGQAASSNRKDEAKTLVATSVAEYRKADGIKAGDSGVQMQLARAALAQSDAAGAEGLFRGVIERDRTYQAAYRELYQLLMLTKRPADAEIVLRSAWRNNPKAYVFLTTLALHYLNQNDQPKMLATLDELKSHASEYADAYLDAGDFYLRVNDLDGAIREYRTGMGKDTAKDRKPVYQKRVIEALMRQGKSAEAFALNTSILKDNPNDAEARGMAAAQTLDAGDASKALTELQSVASSAPENPVVHYNLGRAHAQLNQLEQARQEFQKATDLRSDYLLARVALARLDLTRGDWDAAQKSADRILAASPNEASGKLLKSAALIGARKFSEARQLLEDLVRQQPDSVDAAYQFGALNLAEQKYAAAESNFRKVYQLTPNATRGLLGIADALMAQKKNDAAMSLLQTAADKDGSKVEIRVALANLAVRAGKTDLGIGEYGKALSTVGAKSKAAGEIYLRLGEAYNAKGDFASGAQNLQQARQIMPDNLLVLKLLALSQENAGHFAEARATWEAAMKLAPNDGVVLNNLAFRYAEDGADLNQALTLAQKAKQLLPDAPDVSDTLGWIYYKKNLNDSAIDIFRGLVAKQPTNAGFRYHLGAALLQKGDKSGARKELGDALKSNPKPAEKTKIQQLIARAV